ncbi:ribonuclease HI [Amphibacillus marinus]|uniref:Ribonuclease HI n=2 Tax=Amphibacillus marinus TaxID=872970 RepID=A0A1H8GKZ2_9BACI|nr:ribonuclease HI [Amphibacillus marinus]
MYPSDWALIREGVLVMLTVYIDGASAGNPGPSSTSFIIQNKQEKIQGFSFIGQSTNHEAELQALINALLYCEANFPDQILSIRSDSMLVVDMVEKGYTKNKTFKPLLDQALSIIAGFPHCFIKWIPDQQNKPADQLARHALQTKKSAIIGDPSS